MPAALTEALPERHAWAGRPTEPDLAPLPGCAAVLLLFDAAERPIQLLSTQHLRRWMTARLLSPSDEPTRRTDLAAIARGVRWRPVACPFDARLWFYRLARTLYPDRYRDLIAFGPAHYLNVDWSVAIPEIRVTDRIWRVPGQVVGPWPTHRACQQALEQLWDLFDLCRYPEQVRRAPAGQRCAYAEMGRCDAPCDGGAPLSPYVDRCRAAWTFACGGGEAWMADAESRMRDAARALRFEAAALLKVQLATAREWTRFAQPTIRRDDAMRCLLGLPATRRKAWKVWRFDRGTLLDGPIILERRLSSDIPAWLGSSRIAPPETDDVVRMENSWLLGHLLQHKDRAAAVLVDDTGDDAAVAQRFIAEARSRRAAPETSEQDWGEASAAAQAGDAGLPGASEPTPPSTEAHG